DEDAAVNGALALGRMTTAAQPAVSAIVQLLSDQTRSVNARGNAPLALGAIGLTNEMVVSALMNGTRNPELHIRMGCTRALWQMGGRFTTLAVRRIIEWYAQHPDEKWDLRLLQRYLGLDIQAAIPVLNELLESDSPEIRQA